MHERICEQMSALMDEALPPAEAELLLRRIAQDPALAAKWSRLHLIRDALQGELPKGCDPALAQRVGAALAGESQPAAMVAAARSRWVRPLAGLAVAASMAAVAVVGFQHLGAPQPGAASTVAEAPKMSNAEPTQVARAGTRWDRPEAAYRLNSYLVNHNEYAAGAPLQGMMSYVRIAGYDAEP